MGRVIRRGQAAQRRDNASHAEAPRNAHDSAEHQLGLHGRQRDIVQLLPPVPDSVDGAGLVILLGNSLEACDKGQECGSDTGPQGNADNQAHHVFLILEPQDGLLGNTVTDQHGVYVPLGIIVEQVLEDQVHVPGNGRGIEYHGQNRPQNPRQLIEHPGQQEAEDITHRPYDQGDDKGISDGFFRKHPVAEKQPEIIAQAHKLRRLQNIKGRKAQSYGH